MLTKAIQQIPLAENAFKLQLDGIVRDLKSDYEVWKYCHLSGCPIVVDIAKTYGKCLTKIKNMHKLKTKRALRQGRSELSRSQRSLKAPTSRLMSLVDQLLDAREHTRKSLAMLRRICVFNTDLAQKIYYCNWQLSDILEFAESVMRLYDAEYEIKEMVMEELTKTENPREIAVFRQAWRNPNHALTAEFAAMFDEFNYETREVTPAP